MNSCRKTLWVAMVLCSLMIFACVTINIYFPAEKVESVAGEIVNDIRGREGDKKDESMNREKDPSLRETLLAFLCPVARADQVTTVSNPTIRALKEKMKDRYARMKPFYLKGILMEGDNGFVSMGHTKGLGLREKRDLKNLTDAENSDRKTLYAEIAKALKIDPGQVNKIAEIFAKEWQKPVR